MSAALSSGIHSPRLHTVLYSLLLVATPFVLLQNFLVERISALSSTALTLGDLSIPIMPLVAAILVIALVVALRAYITRSLLIGVAAVIVMLVIANQITDYYFDHNFYDLQQNWHYLAYGIFAWMIYRDLTPRKVPAAKVMLITYLAALGFSTFDEVFQMQLSSRVFDICDIGKDLWGCLMGIVMIYFATTDRKTLATEWRQVRQPQLKDDFRRRP
ncbi:MAG: VanZ family protein, partial [bacterium]